MDGRFQNGRETPSRGSRDVQQTARLYLAPATICQEKGAENNVKSREDILCG